MHTLQNQRKIRAVVYIVITGILWGTSGIFSHLLEPYGLDALQRSALRGTGGLCTVLLWAAIRRQPVAIRGGKNRLLTAFVGLALFGTGAFYFLSMAETTIATAVVLMYTAPVLVLIYSVIFFHEQLTPAKAGAIAAMATGCVLVSGILGGGEFHGVGVVYGILSGISYAVYNILTKIATRRKLRPMGLTAWAFVVMAALAWICCRPAELLGLIAANPLPILAITLVMGLVTYTVPYVLYTLAMEQLPVGTAATLGIVEPMSAAIFGVVLLGEPVSVTLVIGVVLILGAVCLIGAQQKET